MAAVEPAVRSAARSIAPAAEGRPAGRPRRSVPAYLPSLAIGLVWLVIATSISVAEHATYNSTSRDFGVYLQVLWNTAHGRPFATTLLESNRVHLAEHVALLLPLLAPLYAAWPDPRWPLVLQHAVLGLSAAPVYLLARRLLGGTWLPTLVVVAFFASPVLTEIAFDAFYPVTFTALPLGFATYFFLTGRYRAGAACALVALPIEEEAALTVLGLGVFLLLRRDRRRLGAGILAAAALWLGAVAFVVMPRIHEPSTLPSADNRTVGHFDNLRRDPAGALGIVVTERVPLALRWLVAPTGGLALLAPQVLLIDAPHAATLLIADNAGRYRRHWAAPMLPAIWLASVVGLARLRRPPFRALGVAALVAGAVVTYWADSNLPAGGDHEPGDVVWTDRAEQLDHLIAAVPPGASVASSRRTLGHLADRPELYVFPPNYRGKLWPPDRRIQTYVLDLTNDDTQEALASRGSPLRDRRPYAIWLAGPDAAMLTDRPPAPTRPDGRSVAGVHLLGHDLRQAGQTLDLTLHWRASERPSRPLERVVRIVDPSGAVLAERRGTALDPLFPANEWPAGQVVLDRVRLDLSPDRSARLEVGWIDQNRTAESLELPLDGARAR